MKIISKKYSAKWGGELVKREFELMKEVSHPLIVNVIYVFPTETTYNFVIEYCPGATLYRSLRQNKKFSIKRALVYFAEMLCMMRYLHTHDVLFRDLKVNFLYFFQFNLFFENRLKIFSWIIMDI